MEEASKDVVVARFNKLDLHDDNLLSVKVSPARAKSKTTTIDFDLQDDATGAKKVLSFSGCANLRFLMDFDVLANNWFAQTDGAVCQADASRMKKFVRAQQPHWHVRYMPPIPKDMPIRKKLSGIRGYRLFRIRFFGGSVELLAKTFAMKVSKAI
jgi:hypothetical protein